MLKIHVMKDKFNSSNINIVELSTTEICKINGGSWLSYAVGYIAGMVMNGNDAYHEGTKNISGPRR
jgi:hypothetical protein